MGRKRRHDYSVVMELTVKASSVMEAAELALEEIRKPYFMPVFDVEGNYIDMECPPPPEEIEEPYPPS